MLLGQARQLGACLALQRRRQQSFVPIGEGGAQLIRERRAWVGRIRALNEWLGALERHAHRDAHDVVALRAVERQRPVRHHAAHRLGKVVIQPVDAFGVLLARVLSGRHQLCADRPLSQEERADRAANRRILHRRLGADIARAGQRRGDRVHAQFGIDEWLCGGRRVAGEALLAQDEIGQRL